MRQRDVCRRSAARGAELPLRSRDPHNTGRTYGAIIATNLPKVVRGVAANADSSSPLHGFVVGAYSHSVPLLYFAAT